MTRNNCGDAEALVAAGALVIFLLLFGGWMTYRYRAVGDDCETRHSANTCEALAMCNWAEDPFYCRARVLSEAP